MRRGGGKLAIQLAEEVLAAMAKEGARKEYLRRVERDRDRHRLRQLEAGGGARDADLDTVQELEGLVTKPHIPRLNSAYSTKDARQAFVAHTMGEFPQKQAKEAKALVHGNAGAAQVQVAAVAKHELTWPEAKAQVHGDGTAARTPQ